MDLSKLTKLVDSILSSTLKLTNEYQVKDLSIQNEIIRGVVLDATVSKILPDYMLGPNTDFKTAQLSIKTNDTTHILNVNVVSFASISGLIHLKMKLVE